MITAAGPVYEFAYCAAMACQAHDEPAIMRLIRELVPEMQAPAAVETDNVIPFEARSRP